MFEISFPELVILAVVALLVLGPERLPRAAQFAGLWVRRARAHWFEVKSQFERELADEELRKSLEDTRKTLDEAGAAMREGVGEADAAAREINRAAAAASDALRTEAASITASAPPASGASAQDAARPKAGDPPDPPQ